MKINHRIFVKNGQVKFYNRPFFDESVKQFEGKNAILTIGPDQKTRSDRQNRYYWGVVIKILSDELGYFPEEIHEVLKIKFLPPKEVEMGGYWYNIIGSTTGLDTKEFEDYTAKIRIWAADDLKISIPEPNEVEI